MQYTREMEIKWIYPRYLIRELIRIYTILTAPFKKQTSYILLKINMKGKSILEIGFDCEEFGIKKNSFVQMMAQFLE